jgi:hypothetical protein
MVKRITYAGLVFATLATGWVVIFDRAPGQYYPREMIWVFYVLTVPIFTQCWIFTDRSFWQAVWKSGLPVSPILEKKWSEQYLVIRGMCVNNRKSNSIKLGADNGKYGSLYRFGVNGLSGAVLSEGIRIRKVLLGLLVALIISLIITAPLSGRASLSLKGQIATSWPVVWGAVTIMQLMIFAYSVFALYWVVAKFVSLWRGEK